MRRLGDHMVEEVKIMQHHVTTARERQDVTALKALQHVLTSLGLSISLQEMVALASKTPTEPTMGVQGTVLSHNT